MRNLFSALSTKSSKRTIGARLLFYILLISFFFTLLGTSLQLYLDYASDIDSIESRIEQLESSYLKSLTKSTWDMDVEGVQLQLEGALELSDIVYLEIRTELGNSIASSGQNLKTMSISRQFPLVYNHHDEFISVGTLYVVASMKEVYYQLWKKLLVILSTQAIKIFCMSAFILFIFQRLITRHLAKMASYTEKVDLNHLDQPLVLNRRPGTGISMDEIDVVVNAFNEMRENLINDISQRKQAEESLKKSEKQYRMLVELMNDALIRVDSDTIIQYANPKASEILGYSQKDLLGKSLMSMFDENNQKIVKSQLKLRKKGFNTP